MGRQYLKDKAYEILKDKILNCEYEPGTLLNEVTLIEEIGASRTPIHDAIVMLSNEKLVTIIPKKGIIVNGITLKDMVEVLDARIIIEPVLVQRYGDLLDKTFLSQYIDRCREACNVAEKIKLDEELHAALYSVCRNQILKDMVDRLYNHNHRNRIWRSNESRVNDTIKEHIEIAKQLLSSNYEAASEAMVRHLEQSRLYAMKKYV